MIAGSDQTIALSLYARKELPTGLAVCDGTIIYGSSSFSGISFR
jgi:hypothetical protein